MVFAIKNLIFLIISIGFLRRETLAEYLGDLTKHQVNTCNEDVSFPEAPCCGVSNQLVKRIYGGKNAELNEFPWLVHIVLEHDPRAFTGGSLINSRWVLSAAHSLNFTWKKVHVHLGEWNTAADIDCVDSYCKPKAKIIEVDKWIIHELYDINKHLEHDIVLLHLAEPVTFTEYVRPICLPLNAPDMENVANKIAVVAGWGLTESGSESEVLLKASVKLWDSLKCQKETKTSNQICAGFEEGIGPCIGDSGGPLMLEMQNGVQAHLAYYQIGVVSYGLNGCGKNPVVYADVSSYIKWINDTMSGFQ